MSKILGLSFFYHDSAACVLVDGQPVAMAEEERFSRKKHDSGFPKLAIDFTLQKAGITAADLDWIIFYEKPFIKFDRILKTSLAMFPFAPSVFRESIKHLFLDKLWVRQLIADELNVAADKILFSNHHLSHAASAYFCSPFDSSAILTIDGVGEWATTTIAEAQGNNIKILKEINFPHSLGLLYSAFTSFLGFEVNEGEYKVMGMAPYGQPCYVDKVKKLINFFDDGSFSLNLEYFSFHRSLEKTYSSKFIDLFGKPRDPKSRFFTRVTGWPSYFGPKPAGQNYEKEAQEQEHYANIAASIQIVLEEAVTRLASTAYRLTNSDNLCLAGGVALNSVANWKIKQSVQFKSIYIQPAAGDGGGALGAALAANNIVFGNDKRFILSGVDWGKSYTENEVKTAINQDKDLNFIKIDSQDELVSVVAKDLADGKVIGWFQGQFEWGPRALGNRSIIADPRREEMKDIVNTKIKFREPYRPFAPSVLVEQAEEYFELTDAFNQYPAQFMLYVVPVRENKRQIIPAVTHVDGSARPQLVFKASSPLYYKLIEAFYKLTGVPMIMNTSFNLKGEPIVTSPNDAIKTFKASSMDILVMENYVVTKS